MSARLASFYAALFLVIGIQLPFFPVWLAGRGMSPSEIGAILAATSGVRIVAGPALGPFADRVGRRRQIVIGLALCALAGYAMYLPAEGFAALFAVTLVSAFFFSAIMPMTESLTLLSVRTHGLDYGRIRLWGSIAFIVMATAGGRALSGAPSELVLWLLLGGLVLLAAASLALPDVRTAPSRARKPLRALFAGGPGFALMLTAASLLQASHAVYYGFATLHWRAAGLSETLIGALWAEGVVCEIVLFAVSGAFVARLGVAGLFAASAAAGIVRWCVLATTDAVWAIAAAQTLHALTFAASHLAAMRFIARALPPEAISTAQSLYYATVGGVASALFMLGAGALYGRFGAHAYFAMAAAAAAGGVVAWALGRLAPERAVPAAAEG